MPRNKNKKRKEYLARQAAAAAATDRDQDVQLQQQQPLRKKSKLTVTPDSDHPDSQLDPHADEKGLQNQTRTQTTITNLDLSPEGIEFVRNLELYRKDFAEKAAQVEALSEQGDPEVCLYCGVIKPELDLDNDSKTMKKKKRKKINSFQSCGACGQISFCSPECEQSSRAEDAPHTCHSYLRHSTVECDHFRLFSQCCELIQQEELGS